MFVAKNGYNCDWESTEKGICITVYDGDEVVRRVAITRKTKPSATLFNQAASLAL